MKFSVRITIIISILLAAVSLLLFLDNSKKIKFVDNGENPDALEIEIKGAVLDIKPYYSQSEDMWIYFLPSFVKQDILQEDEPFELECDGEDYRVVVKKSQNLSTLFINTESGNLDYLNENKENREPGFLTAIDKDGKIEYCDKLKKVTGRGNASWSVVNKKQYGFELENVASLSGLECGKKYNLHSMVYEGDKLHSKFIYDLADYFDEEFAIGSDWVDVYFNGEFYGLYLLREANKIEKGRLEIEKDGFLVELDREGSWDENHEEFFYSDRGAPFVFRYPLIPTDDEKQSIKSDIDCAEEAIVNQLPLTELVDTRSFAIQYLCNEISKNYDAFKSSEYFYKKDRKDILHAGPAWDYDAGFGELIEEGEEYTNPNGSILGLRGGQLAWYSSIIYNEQFNIDKITLFIDALPWIKEKLDAGFDEQSNLIRKSMELDDLRWKDDHESLSSMYPGGLYQDYDNDVKYFKWFLANRINNMIEEWSLPCEALEEPASTGEEHIVTFIGKTDKIILKVMDGESLGDRIPEGDWVIGETFNPMNRYVPIYEDMIVRSTEE